MKKIILSTVLVGAMFSASSLFAEEVVGIQAVSAALPSTLSATVTAQPTTDVVIPSVPEVTPVYPTLEKAESFRLTSVEKMKTRGAQLIKERINSLNSNAQAIASSKVLTVDQKNAFAGFFSGKIADLNTLGGKIASSTDATTTKALVSSIFTDHRIYGVLIPQLRLEKRLYELQNHGTKLTETFVKVQARIDEFKAKGKDVTMWQKNLDDAKVLVNTDTQKLGALLVKINALQPADYGTTSKAVIESVNKDVKTVARDFQSINAKVKRPEFMKAVKEYKKKDGAREYSQATTTVR